MIDFIIEFVKQHPWLVFVVLGLAIGFHLACFIFVICRKPVKVVDTIKQMILQWLPGVVVAAENTKLKGDKKLQYAVDLLYSLFAKDYLTREEFDNKYLAFVYSQIEAILSTPQKKEDK